MIDHCITPLQRKSFTYFIYPDLPVENTAFQPNRPIINHQILADNDHWLINQSISIHNTRQKRVYSPWEPPKVMQCMLNGQNS